MKKEKKEKTNQKQTKVKTPSNVKKNEKKKGKELLLEKKVFWLSILVIFLILVVVLSILIIHQKRVEKGYPVVNIINQNGALKKQHCLDDFCIDNMTIAYYKDSLSSISGELTYNGENTKDICFKITFFSETNDQAYDYNTCNFEVEKGSSFPIETYFHEDKKDLIYIEDYRLSYLSEEERDQLYEAREEELENSEES